MIYDDVLRALAAARVRFVVTGGTAVALHGLPRRVRDLDVVADPAPANLDALLVCAASLGFTATLPLPLQFVVVMRLFDPDGRELDVNRLYPIAFAELAARAVHVQVGEAGIAIASKADLVAVKRARGRDYDLEDVLLLETP